MATGERGQCAQAGGGNWLSAGSTSGNGRPCRWLWVRRFLRLGLGVSLGPLLVGALAARSAGAEGVGAREAPVGAPVASAPVVLDLNMATAAQLARLPGLGPKRAEAIVAARARRPFSRVTQLLSIRGIGPRIFRQLRGRLTVGPGGGSPNLPRTPEPGLVPQGPAGGR